MPDRTTRARWLETADSRISETYIGPARVSTVFLGIDYAHELGGPAQLFETMIFGGVLDRQVERYADIEEAMRGHERVVVQVRVEEGIPDEAGVG